MKIALVSLNQVWEDKSANKVLCYNFIQKAVSRQVDLVIFPEMTLTGFSMAVEKTAENFEDSETLDWFRSIAVKFSINIIFGVVFSYKNRVKNHLILLNKKGEILGNYEKIHPFSYTDENLFFVGGDELVISDFYSTKLGFTICYDLRFPELFQGLSKDCEVIINIANWPKRRIDHWRTLLKARAIENQVFMIGVNRTGIDGNNIEYEKSSLIFAPDGTMLDPDNLEYELDFYDINHEMVSEVRNIFPVKNDRKIDLYKVII